MNNLRQRVKMLKAIQGISYKELAEYIEISPKSFYSWLNGQYEFSDEREQHLIYVLTSLEEIK